jgi:hypothetical protein
VSAAADRVVGHPEQGQDHAHHDDDDDADRPDDGNLAINPIMRRIMPRIIKGLLTAGGRSGGRKKIFC